MDPFFMKRPYLGFRLVFSGSIFFIFYFILNLQLLNSWFLIEVSHMHSHVFYVKYLTVIIPFDNTTIT